MSTKSTSCGVIVVPTPPEGSHRGAVRDHPGFIRYITACDRPGIDL
nr:hypothetical protein [Kibdelosporangium sp. MJ126-NF4]